MAEQRHTGNPGNFAEDREKASRAGHVGGQHSSGNFANDRERAAEAGRKGGEQSHGGGGAQNNPGNFAQDRERPRAGIAIGESTTEGIPEGNPEQEHANDRGPRFKTRPDKRREQSAGYELQDEHRRVGEKHDQPNSRESADGQWYSCCGTHVMSNP